MDVDAPLERDADPSEVERERPRRDAELPRPSVSLHELPEQEAGRPERDRVERHEQLVIEEVHPERDEGERREGDEPWLAPEEPGEQRAEQERSTNRRCELPCTGRRERRDEQDRADSCVGEAGDAVPPRPRDEEDRQAETGDRSRNLGQPDHFRRTLTTALAACPCSATTRW